jgi:hypothetical protein
MSVLEIDNSKLVKFVKERAHPAFEEARMVGEAALNANQAVT